MLLCFLLLRSYNWEKTACSPNRTRLGAKSCPRAQYSLAKQEQKEGAWGPCAKNAQSSLLPSPILWLRV